MCHSPITLFSLYIGNYFRVRNYLIRVKLDVVYPLRIGLQCSEMEIMS